MTTEKYITYSLRNFTEIPQIQSKLSEIEIETIKVVGTVLSFKTNNYIINELINWDDIPDDPIFQQTFPQKGMLSEKNFNEVKNALDNNCKKEELISLVKRIRTELNPNPADQNKNVPTFNNIKLTGVQHKYKETVLFFPSEGQTCLAFCTFCFRWSQFGNKSEDKFAMKEVELLRDYLKEHSEVTDILFTGGDPMTMSANKLTKYIEPLINNNIPNLKTIRIGTKSLGFWPNRFLTDKDSDDIIRLFEKIVDQGYHLTIMAHFNHPRELQTEAVQKAIKRIQKTGAKIRTQSPVIKHINDDPKLWKEMWQTQVNLGCIPYYMFIARNTGAHRYFSLELERAWNIYREAYQCVSGIARTVRGPIMSSGPGKIQVLGINKIGNDKVFTLSFLQGRNADWVCKPFFAEYNPNAKWLNDLKPYKSEKFFFEE